MSKIPDFMPHAPDSAAVLAAAATNYIVANAGGWAEEVEAYVPGLVAAQLAALAAHNLQIK
jgi:hypothetical protein